MPPRKSILGFFRNDTTPRGKRARGGGETPTNLVTVVRSFYYVRSIIAGRTLEERRTTPGRYRYQNSSDEEKGTTPPLPLLGLTLDRSGGLHGLHVQAVVGSRLRRSLGSMADTRDPIFPWPSVPLSRNQFGESREHGR